MIRQRFFAIAAALSLVGMTTRISAAPVDDLEVLVARWVDMRTQLAAEQQQWDTQREHLEREIDLLEREEARLSDSVATLRLNTTSAEEEKNEALVERANIEAVFTNLVPAVSQAEAHLRTTLALVPPSLQAGLAVKTLPDETEASPAGTLTRRMQSVIALYSELEMLQSKVHVGVELVDTGAGEQQVDVLYLGLARGFAVSADGSWAGIGVPTPAGWRWSPRPDIAAAVRQALEVFNRDQPAVLVDLPLSLENVQ